MSAPWETTNLSPSTVRHKSENLAKSVSVLWVDTATGAGRDISTILEMSFHCA